MQESSAAVGQALGGGEPAGNAAADEEFSQPKRIGHGGNLGNPGMITAPVADAW
jgi:hypothetical protein